jgi:hypothetical protein
MEFLKAVGKWALVMVAGVAGVAITVRIPGGAKVLGVAPAP